jgi:WD40 repeat protein
VHTKAALFTLDITDSQFGTILWASDDHTLVVDCYESEPDSDSDTVGLCSFDAQTGSTKFLHEITTYPKGNAPHLIHSAWNRKETLLASVNESFTRGFLSAVMVFDVGTNALIYIGEGQIFDWKPNTDTLTAVIGNGEIRTYDTKNREVLAESQWFTAPINDIAIRPSDDQIASTGFGYWQDTHVWDLSESTLDPLLSFRAEPAEIVDYTPDGSQLIAGGTITTDIVVNQQIDSFDADTGKRLRDIASYYQQGGYAPSFIWNADYTAELSSPHNIVYSPETFPAHISWSRDYSMISIVEQSIQDIDFKIGLWDAATGKLLNRFDDGMFAFKDLIWSPTGTHFAITLEHTTGSGVYVRSVHVFKAEVYEGEADDFYIQTPPVYEIDTDVDIFESNQQARVAWNHDGTLLAVILPDRLEIHDLAGDGTPLVTLPAYGIVDLEWSSDDRFIAGGSEDGLIYLWGVP